MTWREIFEKKINWRLRAAGNCFAQVWKLLGVTGTGPTTASRTQVRTTRLYRRCGRKSSVQRLTPDCCQSGLIFCYFASEDLWSINFVGSPVCRSWLLWCEMMVPYSCLILLCLSWFRQYGVVTAISDGLAHSRQSLSSSLHWPAIVGADDRSRRTVGNANGRLERSLFASGGAVCSEQSEISENTIIRTKDSRALGARFLNETSLGPDARDRCLNLCCSFHGCNVAVYEEKVRPAMHFFCH